jgi:hypothetical protein
MNALLKDVQSPILVIWLTKYKAIIQYYKSPTPQRTLYTALWPKQPSSSEQGAAILQQDPATLAVLRSSFKVCTARPAAGKSVRSLNLDHEPPAALATGLHNL